MISLRRIHERVFSTRRRPMRQARLRVCRKVGAARPDVQTGDHADDHRVDRSIPDRPVARPLPCELGAARARALAMQAIGLPPDRGEVDADWMRKRIFDIEQSRGTLAGTFAEYSPASQRLLRFAGLDPEHALVRWGNFDRTVLLPSTVFEPDQTGRSYRFRPNTRSIWVRNFPMKGQIKAYFPVPDTPDLTEVVSGTTVQIVDGSTQTTNSWGLRGPEPDLRAPWRGIVLGDSYMQGLFVGDRDTPVECLKRDLKARLGAAVEILNTGHLGYSPEQYYYSLIEYARRFPPQFVVVSVFANDFGDFQEVLEGRGDWEEGAYWLNLIWHYCYSHSIDCVIVPAPWVNQIEGRQMAGNYPGKIANILESSGPGYLDPIAEFANAQLEINSNAKRLGLVSQGSPLFNGRIGDGHFSRTGVKFGPRRLAAEWPSRLKNDSSRILRLRYHRGPYLARANPRPCPSSGRLLPDNLDEHALRSASVELAIEDLLPRAKIQLPFCDRHHDLAAHDLALVVGVGIILAGAVMMIPLR